MKNFYIFGGVIVVGLIVGGLNLTTSQIMPETQIRDPHRAIALASDQLAEMVYLPDDTCRFDGEIRDNHDIEDYRNIVRNCVALRHRQMKIEPIFAR